MGTYTVGYGPKQFVQYLVTLLVVIVLSDVGSQNAVFSVIVHSDFLPPNVTIYYEFIVNWNFSQIYLLVIVTLCELFIFS